MKLWGTVGAGVGTGATVGLKSPTPQDVYEKQLRPLGQSLLSPEGQGWSQLAASSKLAPQKKDPALLQGVYAKHFMPSGQSECSPEGQGSEHVEAASSHECPHMKESRS